MELKRRANGKGSAVYLGKGRAKPWGARITLGWDINGIRIVHMLGTFSNKLDALFCLEQYHKNPKSIYIKTSKYNRIISFSHNSYPLIPVDNPKKRLAEKINKENYTFNQVYEIFKISKFPTEEERKFEKERNIKPIGKFTTQYTSKLANCYNYSKELHNYIYKDLITSNFQSIIDAAHNDGYSSIFQRNLLSLFKHLDKYALQENIITRGYAQYASPKSIHTKKVIKTIFTPEEILAWENLNTTTYLEELTKNVVIFSLYTGCRASEILFLENKNIHIDKNYMISGIKTEAGKNREIPIHSKIKHIIKKYYNKNNQFLFTYNLNPFKYATLSKYIKCLELKNINLGNHSIHECRHTFRTELERLGIRHVTINAILGHKNKDVGLDIYTHISLEEKIKAVQMVNYSIKKLILLKTAKH